MLATTNCWLLTFIDGSFKQRLPLLEVSGVSSEQQPSVWGFLFHHGFIEISKDVLFFCQTLNYMVISRF